LDELRIENTMLFDRKLILGALVLGWLGTCGPARVFGLDCVRFERDGRPAEIEGRLLVTAQDGGLLVQTPDGVLWRIQPEELAEHTTNDEPFEPLSADELARQLLGQLPPGFQVHSTKHYLICHNTSRAYAQWCASLFERLYMAFTNFWTRKGFDLSEPEFPLAAILFADRQSYMTYSRPEAGEAIETIIGYYSLRTNRMVTYDLTGVETFNPYGRRLSTPAQINRILAHPDAERTVATIVHEATHQIAYNCGLHARFSDCPWWFSEGIAVYFETPDLSSSRGWRGIGMVNRPRLGQFRDYQKRRPADSLVTLLSDDARLKSTETGPDAYAEAWALSYFLLNRHSEQYVSYLKLLSQKKPFFWDDAPTRLAEFKQVFGDDLQALDAEFLRYTAKLD
jgi:hypothetical protein